MERRLGVAQSQLEEVSHHLVFDIHCRVFVQMQPQGVHQSRSLKGSLEARTGLEFGQVGVQTFDQELRDPVQALSLIHI